MWSIAGLDNSPIYDGAKFVDESDTLDQTDVGMTALYAADCDALAQVATRLFETYDAKIRSSNLESSQTSAEGGDGDQGQQAQEREQRQSEVYHHHLRDKYAGYAKELLARRDATKSAMSRLMWSDSDGLYFNRMWQKGAWATKVAAPTSFYPMLTGTPTAAQAEVMMSRWLTNTTEFCVRNMTAANTGTVKTTTSSLELTGAAAATAAAANDRTSGSKQQFESESDTPCGGYGMPSVSRSNSAFHDNSYWRGRSWGPMNFLVYMGLKHPQYAHIASVQAARRALARQSEATFLVRVIVLLFVCFWMCAYALFNSDLLVHAIQQVEWLENHRVMENYNSQTGVGCDVGNAIPFYHWGALNALIPLMERGVVA